MFKYLKIAESTLTTQPSWKGSNKFYDKAKQKEKHKGTI